LTPSHALFVPACLSLCLCLCAVRQLDLKVFVNDYRTFFQLALTSDQSTEAVIREALLLANLQPDPMYTIFEVVTDFGFGKRAPPTPICLHRMQGRLRRRVWSCMYVCMYVCV
jgi:hypothetical protein